LSPYFSCCCTAGKYFLFKRNTGKISVHPLADEIKGYVTNCQLSNVKTNRPLDNVVLITVKHEMQWLKVMKKDG
jgi:hypothetical protein